MSVALMGLQSGYVYMYVIVATNAAGRAESGSNILQTSPLEACPSGCGTNEQYGSEVPEWYTGLSERESAKTRQEYEANQRQAAKEQEEKQAKEAAFRVTEAAALKQREEEEAAEMAKSSLTLVNKDIRVRDGRVSLVKLECLGSASCHGKLILSTKLLARAGDKAKRVRMAMIAGASFWIAGDEAKTVKVAVDPAGRALLSANRRLKARLTILELVPGSKNAQTTTVYLVQQRTHTGRKGRSVGDGQNIGNLQFSNDGGGFGK